MKALVLGATGHVGNAVARLLVDRGWQVTAVSRRRAPNLAGPARSEVLGDLEAPGALEHWCRGHELVVDAAAPYPLQLSWRGSRASRRRAAARTEVLLEAVRRAGARLAYVGSFVTDSRSTTRSSTAHPFHPYFACKEEIESRLLHRARRGWPIAILRATAILGPWDAKPRELCWLPQIIGYRLPLALEHVVDVVDVRDVAEGLVRAVETEAWGEPILLSGHSLSLRQLSRWICDLAGVPSARSRFLPARLALAPSLLLETLASASGRRLEGFSLLIRLLCAQQWRVVGTSQRRLGVEPRPLSETLRDSILWYRSIGYC